jgi:hypothetical protein
VLKTCYDEEYANKIMYKEGFEGLEALYELTIKELYKNKELFQWSRDMFKIKYKTAKEIIEDPNIYEVKLADPEDFNIEIRPTDTYVTFRYDNDKHGFSADKFRQTLKDYKLENFDFTHIVIAGGAFYDYHGDVDMFIVGGEANKQKAINTFIEYFKHYTFIISNNVINVSIGFKHLQLILRVYDNVKQLLDSFDIGASCVYYQGGDKIYANAEAMHAISYNTIIVNKDRIRTNFARRLNKYVMDKGFSLLFIDDISEATTTITKPGYKPITFIKLGIMVIAYNPRNEKSEISRILMNSKNAFFDYFELLNSSEYYMNRIPHSDKYDEEYIASLTITNFAPLNKLTNFYNDFNDYYNDQNPDDLWCAKNERLNKSIDLHKIKARMGYNEIKHIFDNDIKKIRIPNRTEETYYIKFGIRQNIVELKIRFERFDSPYYSAKNPVKGLSSLF